MPNFKPTLKILLNSWMKFTGLWNKTVIFILLLVIYFLILTPTALIRRLFQILKNRQIKKADSFLKKSINLDSEHFTKPF